MTTILPKKDPFAQYYEEETPVEENAAPQKQEPIENDPFANYYEPEPSEPVESEESLPAQATRKVSSAIQGGGMGYLLRRFPAYAASVGLSQLSGFEAITPEEIEHMRKIHERAGKPFNEEKYIEEATKGMRYGPTLQGMAALIEDQTGLPLESKSYIDKMINFVSGATSLNPGNITQKATTGLAATDIKMALHGHVPEEAEDLLTGLLISPTYANPQKQGPISPQKKANQLRQQLVQGAEEEPPPGGGGGPPKPVYPLNKSILEELQAVDTLELQEAEQLANQKYQADLKQYEALGLEEKEANDLAMTNWQAEVDQRKADFKLKQDQREAQKTASKQQHAQQMAEYKAKKAELTAKGKQKAPKVDLRDQAGDLISKDKFHNSTEGGIAAQNMVMEKDRAVYKGVGKLYDESRILNDFMADQHKPFFDWLTPQIDNLERIPSKSRNSVQNHLLASMKQMRNTIVTFDENKNITGFKPVNNQVFIDASQAMKGKIDHDFAHGDASGIIKPYIRALEDHAKRNAVAAGDVAGAESLTIAQKAYAKWADIFDNDTVRPFRDTTNKNYTKLYDQLKKIDESNILKEALGSDQAGMNLIQKANRDLIEDKLGKFFVDPAKHSPRDFEAALREVEAVIGKEQVKPLRGLFNEARLKPPQQKKISLPVPPTEKTIPQVERPKPIPKPKPIKIPREKPKPPKKQESKFLKLDPEHIDKEMDTPSGIYRMKSVLSKTEKGRELLKERIAHKTQSITTKGKINYESTAQELSDFLHSENNYELMVAMHGEDTVNRALQEASSLANKDAKLNMLVKTGKYIGLSKLIKGLGLAHGIVL